MKHIKSFEKYTAILEKKADILDYPNIDSLGLVVKNVNRNNRTTKFLSIFDFKLNKTLAYIELRNIIDKNVFEVERVFAEKNWGPLIYDYALMFAYPKSVAPSKTIKPGAIKVWKYYYDFRDDVIKKAMNINDESYSSEYKNDEMDDVMLSDDNLIYLNCYYSLNPSLEYTKLSEKGAYLLKKHGMIPSDVFKIGYKQFKNIYLS